jgi:hypothetical protein
VQALNKYAHIINPWDYIKMMGIQDGSIIWNALWKNKSLIIWNAPWKNKSLIISNAPWKKKSLIQDHILWEIKDGKSALFCVDSWKHLPKLHSNLSFPSLKASLQETHGTTSLDWR